MLTIFGSINIDKVIRVPSIPKPGETTLGVRVMDAHGGKGANQAIAAARAGAGDVPVMMIGAVGEDDHGHSARENFAENGVRTEIATLSEVATGTAFITLSQDGENAITVAPGANGRLTTDAASPSTLSATSVLLCQGEVCLSETVAVMSAYRKARPEGTIILNLAPVPGKDDAEAVSAALELSDVVVVNALEADAVSGLLLRQGDLPALSQQYHCSVVVTLGPDGAELVTPSGSAANTSSPRIDPVDTTGAGDTFCGVIAMLMAEGQKIEPAMTLACKAAALACSVVGAQTGMPKRADILKDTSST
ncbi:PfkB family carbohydrate kinase [Ruegeria sp. HKCCD8929]|uniref:PfkB family carbohydrate kinase n=1 Tax=Ruegeria sp. HKCCD8929 TaxID=2683006 RepID=UPI0014893EEF|nr:PfkB family carbohydrate kinase [Ruegeria sp. HKCCD8929]